MNFGKMNLMCQAAIMPDTCCRTCGAEPKVMAVCIRCGRTILRECPNYRVFPDTQVHIGCLYQLPVVFEE